MTMLPINTLSEKYRDIFDFAKDAIENGPKFLNGQNANSLERQITLFHLVRATYLLDAIYRLCREGYATESIVILRSLLNLFINLKWLTSKDSKYRMERYADFQVVFKKLAMNDVIKHGSIWDDIKSEDLTAHDEEFQRIMRKYNLKSRWDFFHWSGKSIYKMAEDVGLEKEYKIIYGRLSGTEHTGPESVRDYLDDSEKGKTIIKAGPRDKNIDLAVLTSLDYFFQVKAITHNIFDVDWPSLESEKQKFMDLRSKYWVQQDND